ncbi:hypothetical protein [Microbacterium sp.]|uniref:hypothetical protein n=1 Tax=Microbacterium sp. TaxID=51671 RepID=UPI003A90C815
MRRSIASLTFISALAIAWPLASGVAATADESDVLLTAPEVDAQNSTVVKVTQSTAEQLIELRWDGAAGSFEEVSTAESRALRPITDDREITVALGVDSDGTVVSRSVNHARPDVTDDGASPLQWSAGTSGVTLSWSVDSKEPVTWSVRRGEHLLYEGTANAYTDSQGDRSIVQEYTVSGEGSIVDEEGKTYAKPYFYKVTVPATDDSAVGLQADDPQVRASTHNRDVVPAGAGIAIVDRTHEWQTFIPDYVVPVPPACVDALAKGGAWFLGDGRSFKADALSYGTFRTRTSLPIWFTGSIGSATLVPGTPFTSETGLTGLYDSNFQLVEQGQASPSGAYVSYTEEGSNFASYTVTHAIGDPLCFVAPPIDYTIGFTSDNLGWMSISGSHDQAPSHEAFWQAANDTSSTTRGCWYRFENRGLDWLLGFSGSPVFPQAYVNLDANPLVAPPTCSVV